LTENPIFSKAILENEGKIKIFLDKQKWKESVASRTVLQETLKKVLQRK
jgi:hypothetical protein